GRPSSISSVTTLPPVVVACAVSASTSRPIGRSNARLPSNSAEMPVEEPGPPEPTPASAWCSGEASAAIADLHQPWPHCLGGSIDGHGPRVVAHASWGDRDG